jgi:hypothetical protein
MNTDVGAGSRPVVAVFPFERHLSRSIVHAGAGRALAVHAVEDLLDRGDIAAQRPGDELAHDQLQGLHLLSLAAIGLAPKRGAQRLAHRLARIAAVGRRIVAAHGLSFRLWMLSTSAEGPLRRATAGAVQVAPPIPAAATAARIEMAVGWYRARTRRRGTRANKCRSRTRRRMPGAAPDRRTWTGSVTAGDQRAVLRQ